MLQHLTSLDLARARLASSLRVGAVAYLAAFFESLGPEFEQAYYRQSETCAMAA